MCNGVGIYVYNSRYSNAKIVDLMVECVTTWISTWDERRRNLKCQAAYSTFIIICVGACVCITSIIRPQNISHFHFVCVCVCVFLIIHRVLKINLKHFLFTNPCVLSILRLCSWGVEMLNGFSFLESRKILWIKVNKSQFTCKLTWLSFANVFVIYFVLKKKYSRISK